MPEPVMKNVTSLGRVIEHKPNSVVDKKTRKKEKWPKLVLSNRQEITTMEPEDLDAEEARLLQVIADAERTIAENETMRQQLLAQLEQAEEGELRHNLDKHFETGEVVDEVRLREAGRRQEEATAQDAREEDTRLAAEKWAQEMKKFDPRTASEIKISKERIESAKIFFQVLTRLEERIQSVEYNHDNTPHSDKKYDKREAWKLICDELNLLHEDLVQIFEGMQ